jgi:hypothetical protein
MFPCSPRPRKRGTLHGLRLMLTRMGGCRTTVGASAVVPSLALRILHSPHFLGREIEAATKQPIKMALVGEASHLSNFGNG